MKISKKMLDEAIELVRKSWAMTAEGKDGYYESRKAWGKMRKLSECLENQIDEYAFNAIINTYVRCNATNETIYKAIELLGIEIE